MKNLYKSRSASFAILAVVYILAIIGGLLFFKILPWNFQINLLVADIFATIIVFAFSVITGNASVYDPYWSVQPVVILLACTGGEIQTRIGALTLLVVSLWGIRLTANWAYTFHGLEYQDWRYTMLHEQTGFFYPIINFIGIHLMPTLIVYGCTLPAAMVIRGQKEGSPLAVFFLCISLGAIILQGTADCQMHKFRKEKKTRFIGVGLWKYSRHPNYLGEILMWWGIGLSAVFIMPDKWYLLAGALANNLLFLCVSIPLADKHQARKEGYEEYRKQTRKLLPIKC